MKWWLSSSFGLAVLVLSACSSGSGGPTAPAKLAPELVESESGSRVNELRAARQLAPLSFDPRLAAVARARSEALLGPGFPGGVGASGDSLRDRLRAAGITFRSAGENLAQVQAAVDPAGEAHAQLIASPGHRDNIVDSRFQLVGVGVARDGGTYWITQIFIEP